MKLKFLKLLSILLLLFTNILLFSIQAIASPSTPGSTIVNSWQQEIHSVLQDERFNYSNHFSWWDWIKTNIAEFFKKIKFKKQPKKYNYKCLNTVLQYLGVILLVLALIFFPKHLIQHEKKFTNKNKQTLNFSNVELLSDEKAKAFKHAAAGEYREAIRYLYLANLAHLKKNALLPEGIKLSDQENLKTLKKILDSEDPIYLAFMHLMNTFQEKWYGLKVCQVEDYTLALNSFNTILENTGKSQ